MSYRNFRAALYMTVFDIERIADLDEFGRDFAFIEKHIALGKVYLETSRSGARADEKTLLALKEFFAKKGILISGGITPNARGTRSWEFQSACYSDPAQIDFLKETVAFTAKHFDEIILDDFFFTSCACERCAAAKGNRSWTEFRLELMRGVSENVIIAPAKQVNPKAVLIIKYPNWYEHYQGTGYNLEDEPRLFDRIYTGTETRDSLHTQQSLPRYVSYFITRYLSNTAPGRNAGTWFDTFDSSHNPNAYLEQGLLTLFARPREVTLFCLGLHLGVHLRSHRLFTPLAGFVFDRADKFLGKLGNPVGLACYKPFHSRGEDYLHGFLGMLGLPLEPSPVPGPGTGPFLLTASAAADPRIVDLIKKELLAGRTVILTSGLVKALAGRGLKDITEIDVLDTRHRVREFGLKTFHCSFENYADARKEIILPEVVYYTNNAQPLIAAFTDSRNVPVLIEGRYGAGRWLVLTVPDDPGDLSFYPEEALDLIRERFMADLPVRLSAPAGIGLFLYDNGAFAVSSFLPQNRTIGLMLNRPGAVLTDLETDERLKGRDEGDRTIFRLHLTAAATRVFSYA